MLWNDSQQRVMLVDSERSILQVEKRLGRLLLEEISPPPHKNATRSQRKVDLPSNGFSGPNARLGLQIAVSSDRWLKSKIPKSNKLSQGSFFWQGALR